ncbi:MAG TPA: aspartate kinase [Anaerolineaceae bacterium]|nr:aspartate kinase [Anaerolineaceae bacterium]HPN51450.1 aspartate kinase [Anaerolineaceae bacterium]
MSKRLVMKFGGTSVGTAAAMRQAAKIAVDARRSWDEVVVVTSALSGVTDGLLNSARQAARGDLGAFEQTRQEMYERHHALADSLAAPAERPALHGEINNLVAEFSNLCQAINVLGEASPRALDAVAALGERLSVRVLAAAISAAGAPARWVESTRLICTDSRFQNAAPDADETRRRSQAVLLPLLEKGHIPVVTGFIGADAGGRTTTLGRGGSDYSASILAVALDAQEVWIWTDVDGVMTADPRLVGGARTIRELSFREVAEMAHYGAKVLHPKSIAPVIQAGICLRVLNTFNPAGEGTRLVSEREANGHGTIKALAAIRGLRLVTLSGTGMLGVPGVAGRIFSAAATTGISVPLIIESTSEQAICFPAPKEKIEEVLESLYTHLGAEFQRGDIDRAAVSEDVDIITVISPGLRSTVGIAGQIFSTLAAQNINVLGISFGASDVSINLLVHAETTRAALQALHTLI